MELLRLVQCESWPCLPGREGLFASGSRGHIPIHTQAAGEQADIRLDIRSKCTISTCVWDEEVSGCSQA